MRSVYKKTFLIAFLLLGTSLSSYAADGSKAPPVGSTETSATSVKNDEAETYRLLKLFGDVFQRTREQYVEPVKDQDLIEAALNGMLTSLDPHSSYMNRDEFRDMQVQTRGEFGGLGIEVTMENGVIKVVSPIDDTPASKAGLQSGDLIVALDGKPVTGLSLQEAVNKMRGTAGTQIKLTVVRRQGEPFDVSLTRAVIRVESVKSRVEGNVGYLRITSFSDRTQEGLNHAIAEIKKKLGDKLEGWVLDLRNNPGGLLEQAISVSDTFLTGGEIVSTRSRDPADNQHFKATPGDQADGKPVVVLINGGSASASEIVAGALQDQHRGIILGTKSFGKGSVQTILQLPGYGAMRLTTQRYYTPSGRSIQAEGIVPDIVVEPAKIEPIVSKGFSYREADLRGALNNDQTPAEKAQPEAKAAPIAPEAKEAKDAKETKDEAKDDYQLTRALDLIHGLSLYQNKGTPVSATPSVASANDKADGAPGAKP